MKYRLKQSKRGFWFVQRRKCLFWWVQDSKEWIDKIKAEKYLEDRIALDKIDKLLKEDLNRNMK